MTYRQQQTDLDHEAARWVLRLDRDNSEAARDELNAWLAADERRPGALLRMEALWASLDIVRDEAKVAEEAADDAPPAAVAQISRRSVFAGLGSLVAAGLAAVYLSSPRAELYETAVGEIRRVPLPDRSTLAINTNSRIEVAFAEERRTVTIDRGEAWFRVAKDKKRPFLVIAGDVRVEAVGTAFSVRQREGATDVMVTEGVVRVWRKGAESGAVDVGRGSTLTVTSGALIKPGAVESQAVEGQAMERKLAWRSGQLNLAGETFGDAVEEFNRYTNIPIVINDPVVARKRLYGVFRLEDPDLFARTAAITLGASYTKSDGRIVID